MDNPIPPASPPPVISPTRPPVPEPGANPVSPQSPDPVPPVEPQNPLSDPVPPADPPHEEGEDPQNPLAITESDLELSVEKLVMPEGFQLDPAAASGFVEVSQKLNLNVEQVNGLVDYYTQFISQQNEALMVKQAAETARINSELKAIPKEELQFAKQAIMKFVPEHERDLFLASDAYVPPEVVRALARAGRAAAEHAAIRPNPDIQQGKDPLAAVYAPSMGH